MPLVRTLAASPPAARRLAQQLLSGPSRPLSHYTSPFASSPRLIRFPTTTTTTTTTPSSVLARRRVMSSSSSSSSSSLSSTSSSSSSSSSPSPSTSFPPREEGSRSKNKDASSSNSSSRLAGRTVVVTGASSGIGRATAREFARACPDGGLRLVVTARRLDALRTLAGEIRDEVGEGVRVHPVQLDISNSAEVRGFVASLPDELRDIDVLVNNAGLVKGVARAPDIAEADMDVMFSTNVTGLINMTQAVLPVFLRRGSASAGGTGTGDIINIGSIAGREPYPGGGVYCASKAAVRSFTESLRKELVATRVRVIGIDPGQVETEFSLVRFDGDKAKADAVYAGCEPLTPEDIAEVVVFAATRRQNVVVADTLVFPNHQAGATTMHRTT